MPLAELSVSLELMTTDDEVDVLSVAMFSVTLEPLTVITPELLLTVPLSVPLPVIFAFAPLSVMPFESLSVPPAIKILPAEKLIAALIVRLPAEPTSRV
jgi:hypothetical protein